MSIARRRLAPLLAAVLLTSLVSSTSWSPVARADDPTLWDALADQQAMEDELARQRAALSDLQRQQADLAASLASINAELASVGAEIRTAAAALDRATRNLAAARADLARYKRQIANLGVDLRRLREDITTASIELAEREELLEEHLRVAYEESQTSFLEVLLSTESLTEASNQLSAILALSDEDRQLANAIRDRREALRVQQATVRDGSRSLASLKEAAARREAQLKVQEAQLAASRDALAEQEALLEQLKDAQDAQYVATAATAEEQALLIAQQEQALAGQIALVAALTEQAKALDIAYRGRFEWPERGPFIVTQEFGATSFSTFHSGIDLSYLTGCGGPIYAAGDATVLADGRPNAAYGDLAIGVVLGHSQRLQTWYWHLSSEVVSVGQSIHTGDIIGYEGATGFATGCHLHFQVMFDGGPVNPRLYLP